MYGGISFQKYLLYKKQFYICNTYIKWDLKCLAYMPKKKNLIFQTLLKSLIKIIGEQPL